MMTDSLPLIYITNDDGIHSPGIHALASSISTLGNVKIIAPTEQQSATGRSLLGDKDEMLIPIDLGLNNNRIEAFHCRCSPALVVSHSLHTLGAERKPDLLVSGINYGENLGMNVTISGTVGAAMQGASMGIPGLAISFQTPIDSHYQYQEVDWGVAADFSNKFAQMVLHRVFPFDVHVLKIDIPESVTQDTPWRVTRLSKQNYFTSRYESPNRSSKIGDSQLARNINIDALEKDSDIYALMIDHVISVTPLSLNLTSRIELNDFYNYLSSNQ